MHFTGHTTQAIHDIWMDYKMLHRLQFMDYIRLNRRGQGPASFLRLGCRCKDVGIFVEEYFPPINPT